MSSLLECTDFFLKSKSFGEEREAASEAFVRSEEMLPAPQRNQSLRLQGESAETLGTVLVSHPTPMGGQTSVACVCETAVENQHWVARFPDVSKMPACSKTAGPQNSERPNRQENAGVSSMISRSPRLLAEAVALPKPQDLRLSLQKETYANGGPESESDLFKEGFNVLFQLNLWTETCTQCNSIIILQIAFL